MNQNHVIGTLMLAAVLGLMAIGTLAHEDEPRAATQTRALNVDGRAVVATLEDFAASYAATDIDAMRALTVSDGRFSYIEGTFIDWTWADYAEHLSKEMPAFSETQYQITDIRPETVNDMAFATFNWAMDVVIMSDQFPAGRHPVSMRGVGTAVLVKDSDSGEWRLRHVQTTRTESPAAASGD